MIESLTPILEASQAVPIYLRNADRPEPERFELEPGCWDCNCNAPSFSATTRPLTVTIGTFDPDDDTFIHVGGFVYSSRDAAIERELGGGHDSWLRTAYYERGYSVMQMVESLLDGDLGPTALYVRKVQEAPGRPEHINRVYDFRDMFEECAAIGNGEVAFHTFRPMGHMYIEPGDWYSNPVRTPEAMAKYIKSRPAAFDPYTAFKQVYATILGLQYQPPGGQYLRLEVNPE